MKTVKNFEFTINGVTFIDTDFTEFKIRPMKLFWKLQRASAEEIKLFDDAGEIYMSMKEIKIIKGSH